jgi:TonB family protein
VAVPGTHDCANFYPEAARRDNESGDVQISYDVAADGTISHVVVVKTSGHALLDRAAVVCVSTAWRNTPAERGGVKIASTGHQAIIRFALTEPPAPTTASTTEAPTMASAPEEPVTVSVPEEEESDVLPLLGLAGLLLIAIGGSVLLIYRRRRPEKTSPLRPVGRDEED